MNIIKVFAKFKNTKVWYIFLKYFILPINDFIWINVVNFKGRKFYNNFKKKDVKVEHHIPENLPSVIVRDDQDFKEIAFKISNSIDHDFIYKKINDIKKDNSISRNRNYIFEFFSHVSDELKKDIINFAKSEKNLAIANDYLKVFPVVGKIHLYVNFPIDNETERASMLWHKDDFGYKSLDLFIPITELNSSNGSMFYLNKKDNLHIFNRIPEFILDAKPKERNKVKINDFGKYYSENEIKEFTGKIGDALLIDSFRVYHRGGYCEKNIRIMFRISYQTPDSSRLQNSNTDYFDYYNKIKKQDISNEMEKYLFFGVSFFSKFKSVVKFLLLFYRIVHVKMKKI